MNTPILIPAFRPGSQLTALVEQLVKAPVPAIIIVDNGNGPESEAVFEHCATLPNIRILRRDTNVGKGAGLKTGIAYILDAFPASGGVVIADADGQHHPDDILRVARSLEQNPDCLVLGCRQFDKRVPLRSRLGNLCTRALTRVILGLRVQDSQTGLRGIPCKFLPYLPSFTSNGFEFELDMLIASKHLGISLVEERIQTIYEPGNPTSHFDPIRDSMRIYFVLFRFGLLSLLTAALDSLAFVFAYRATASILVSQLMSRAMAGLFNYHAARKAVFLSHERHRVLFSKYILLVVASGAASYGLIHLLTRLFAIDLILAKLSAESLLFIANFVLQRDFVFSSRPRTAATDWNQYHRSVPFTARLTRKHTARVLLAALRKFPHYADGGIIVEPGGVKSRFLGRIVRELQPSAYYIVESNDHGLKILSQRTSQPPQVGKHSVDVSSMNLNLHADAVFSVDLIEHFDPAGARSAVCKHFELLQPGGYAILSFPTPTLLYRVARRVTEFFGLWNRPDERPLSRQDVLESVAPLGEVVLEKTLWPLADARHLVVVRKRALPRGGRRSGVMAAQIRRLSLWVVLVAFLALTVYGLLHQNLFHQETWTATGIKRVLIFTACYALCFTAFALWKPGLFFPAVLVAALAYTAVAAGPLALLTVGLILLSSLVLGQTILARLSAFEAGSVSGAILALLLGLSIYMFTVSIAAHAPVNYPAAYLAALAAPLLWNFRAAVGWLARIPSLLKPVRLTRTQHAATSFLIFFLLLHWLVALEPEAGSDGLAVHLTVPSSVALNHQWAFDVTKHLWAVMPMGADWCFTLAYLLGGEAAARLLNLALFLCIAALLLSVIRKWLPLAPALLTVTMFAATPLVQLVTGSLFAENLWALLCLGALLSLGRYREGGPDASLYLAFALLGAAASAKFGALAFLLPCGLIALWTLFGRHAKSVVGSAKTASVALACFLFFSAPPYVTASFKTGDPVFPYLPKTFPSRYVVAAGSGSPAEPKAHLKLSTLFDLTFHTSLFREVQDGAMGFQYLLFLPLSLLLLRRNWPDLALLSGFALVFFVPVTLEIEPMCAISIPHSHSRRCSLPPRCRLCGSTAGSTRSRCCWPARWFVSTSTSFHRRTGCLGISSPTPPLAAPGRSMSQRTRLSEI